MICTKTPAGWLIILQPENLARMKQGDPVTIPDLNIMLCYEDLPEKQLVEKLKSGNPLAYLCRGWQVHPDDFGDARKL